MFTGQTPDITPAQMLAVAIAIGGAAVSLGVVSNGHKSIVALIAFAAIAVTLKLCDAHIRGKRAQALLQPPTVTVTAPSSSSSSQPPPSSSAAVVVTPDVPPPAPATVVTITGGNQGWANVAPAATGGVVVRG